MKNFIVLAKSPTIVPMQGHLSTLQHCTCDIGFELLHYTPVMINILVEAKNDVPKWKSTRTNGAFKMKGVNWLSSVEQQKVIIVA